MVKGIQYGGGISSVRWKTLRTDVSHHQYGRGGHEVWTCHIINTPHQYRGGCAVYGYQLKTAQGVVSSCIIWQNDILQTI